MMHFMQLPNKTVSLLDQELALKNGELTFEFGGTENVLVTETALKNAMAGMSAPITVERKADMEALKTNELDVHKRIFVNDDGDGKWAYYMVTDIGDTEADPAVAPSFTKISDEDIFGALFSDDVTAQISKIGSLDDLNEGINHPANIIEAINTLYNQGVALKTRVGENEDLTTTEKGTLVGAMNELVVNISSNDDDILTIQNNMGDLTTINLTDAADKATLVAALNKIIAVQATKLDAEDVVPIIVSYTGLLTDLNTDVKNSLVEAINEVLSKHETYKTEQAALLGDLTNLTNTDKTTGEVATNFVDAINDVDEDLTDEIARATAAEATLTSNLNNEVARATAAENTLTDNLNTEAATRAAKDGDLTTLTTEVKSNLVNAINEVDANVDSEVARATAAETTLTDNLNTEISDRTAADTAIQTELDNTQTGAGLAADGSYTADATTNYIATATSLTSADKLLDSQAKANADAIAAETARATAAETANAQAISDLENSTNDSDTAIQNELDATQTGAGLAESGAYVQTGVYDETDNPNGTFYIGNAVTLADADKKLDAQVKVNTDAIADEAATRLAADQTIQSNLDTTNANLSQEITDRTNADSALDTRVTTVENQVNGKIGDLNTLSTDAKDNLVNAIKEVDAHADTNAANLAQEIADRTSAVSAEETRATAAETTLTDNLNAEIARATAAENTLTDNLNTESATRAANDGSLTFDESLNTVTQDENGNDIVTAPANLTDAINKENARAKNAEATLQSNLDTVNTTLTNKDNDLQAQLDAEVARATTAESTLDTKIDAAVSNLVDGAPELLDTLNELAAAIGDDENFATTVANNIAAAKAELKGAATEAMDTMGEIEAKINSMESDIAAKNNDQDSALAQEITDRTNADTAITNNLNNEIARATAAETAIQNELDATQTGAGLGTDGAYAADNTTNYLTAATSLKDADKKLDAQAKVNADAIAAETARATDAEITLQTNIDNETTARTNADNALDARVTTVENQVNGKIGDLNTLTTDAKDNLVNAINEVDAHADTNAANLTQEIADRTSAVSAEESRATAAENALQSELDNTQTGAGLATDGTYEAIGAYDATSNPTGGHYIGTAASLKDADKKLDAQAKVNADAIAQEITDRTNADNGLANDLAAEAATRAEADTTLSNNLSAETTRATGAEATLQSNIDTEVARATAAEGNLGFNAALQVDDGEDGTRLAGNLTEAINAEVARASAANTEVTNNLNAEITRATGAEATLQSNIDNETTRATNAENTLTDNLNSEITRATAAESTLQSNIDNEAATRTANDNTLQTNIDNEAATRAANDGSLVFNEPLADATNLTDAINAELARAKTAETALDTSINNETTRATAAETTLTDNLNAEIARATAAEQANADAISNLDSATNATIGNLSDLDTEDKSTVVAAINEVNGETDINTNQISSIKAFINDMISKSGKTVDSVNLVANTAYTIDISDLASVNVTVSVYTISGTILSQAYGLFVDVDTANKTVSIISSIDTTAKIVITSDISGLTIA